MVLCWWMLELMLANGRVESVWIGMKDASIGHDVVVGSMAEAGLSESGMWVSDTKGLSIRRHISTRK
jgi:hypothetical protein